MSQPSLFTRWAGRGWPAGKAFTFIGGVFGCILLVLLFWLADDQRLVLDRSQRLLDETVPQTLNHFRLARNIEQLRLEGERVFSGRTPVDRQQALFVISLLASQPALLADPRAAGLATEVERFLARAARDGMTDERFSEWARLSNRLSLLADDVSIEGVDLATDDLRAVSATMRSSRMKLAVVLALVAIFVSGFVFLVHRHLIRPLQTMDETLAALRSGNRLAPIKPASMLEIRAVEGAIGQLREVMHENEKTRQQLALLATTDGLTGMFNRRHFMALAEEEMKRAQRYGRPICIAMADLDCFKKINDGYGHAVGDQVLQSTSALFAKTLRQSDLACRYGGEEFAFVFPETALKEAHRLTERLRQRAAESTLELTDGVGLQITLSLGLADASSCSLETALKLADAALYEAKEQGRNRVAIAPLTAGEPFDGARLPATDRAPIESGSR